MRVDVQLDDSELALLSGYNRSTTMGIKKPGELQRELLSDMENIEEKREVQAIPEEQGIKQGADAGTVEPKEVASASEDKEEEVKSAPVRVRSDFLSMLSAMAQPNTYEDKDSEGEDEEAGILPEDTEDEEDGSVLPEDEDEEDESVLPEDEEDEDVSVLPEDEDEDEDVGILPEDEEDGSVLPDDDEDEDEDVSTLPDDDDEYTEDDGILPADDEDTDGDSVASEGSTAGITEQQEDDGYSSELPEDDDDEEYFSELPADEDDSSELPEDEEDEEGSSVSPDDDADEYSALPADEDEESSVLPEDDEEVEDEPTQAGIQDAVPTAPNVVENPVSPSPQVQKSVHHATHQPAAHPVGYSAPSVPLYDFILNNGGSMLIEDVRKYYPIDEVKKALSLGKIYRFGNHVGV